MPSNRIVRPVNPTAAQVRAFVSANPKMLDGLSPEARHTVNNRGRLHREVIKAYNKGVKPEKQYVLGASGRAVAAKAAQRAQAAEKGIAVGARGPLSKAALAALSE
jgi:hypothetical protein